MTDNPDACMVAGCPRPATASVRFANGVHRYCQPCAAAAQRQVLQPKLVTDDHQADDEQDTPNLSAHQNQANPFVAHVDILRANYTAAVRIQSLVLHLFNAEHHSVDMRYLMRGTDKHHRAVVFAMLHWYATHGEECAVFMDAARRLLDK